MRYKCLGIAVLLLAVMVTPGPAGPTGSKGSDPYVPLKRFSQILDLVEQNYVQDVSRDELINGAIQGMLQKLDPHSGYLTVEDFKEMQMDTSGEFFGIGIEISLEKGLLTVVSPIEDTPAFKAGMKSGDIILEINGQNTQDISLEEAVKKIRGPAGSKVNLTILHRDAKAPSKFQVERASIPLLSVKDVELEPGYVLLRVTRFRENTTQELHKALNKYRKNLNGIVLDLRNNPGGLLDQSVSMADTFLEDGLIVFTKGRIKQAQMNFDAKKQSTDTLAPMTVLINAGSASASEIVAGALKDRNRAILLGEKTFGKGSVQSVIPLSDGSGVKLTTARYYTPKGTSIQAEGIEPDIILPLVIPGINGEETRKDGMTIREKDISRHLENPTTPNGKDKKSDLTPKAKELLEKDNQLRMALQLVKSLPRFQAIR